MDAVTGFEKAHATITYNGIDLYADEEARKTFVKLVPQYVNLRDIYTVFHTLEDAGRLFLPEDIRNDRKKRKQRVEEVLSLFGLQNDRRRRAARSKQHQMGHDRHRACRPERKKRG
ncbi:MAG: hypothetical protein IJQ12_05360 [Lachnospiraceae bacterium]|nr:hypothetical protein [Lachnospiraceae bacterium]